MNSWTIFLFLILAVAGKASCKEGDTAKWARGEGHYENSCLSQLRPGHGAEYGPRTLAQLRREVVLVAREGIARAKSWAWWATGLDRWDHHVALDGNGWSDCVQLYEDSDYRLKRLQSSWHGGNDAVTWLSAALTSHRTCLDGLRETNSLLPDFAENLSISLTNALAFYALPTNETDSLQSEPEDSQALLMSWDASSSKAHFVVAKDGSGNFKTIEAAVKALAKRGKRRLERVVIYVKSGVYAENVEIGRNVKNVMFIGDGIDKTIVTGNRNVPDGFTTFKSATFGVSGDGFWARDMTFENTAGPGKHQAVALRVQSDRSIFYRCSFRGYQDTLFVHSLRQFYRDCHIYGTVDFIFGNAAAMLQNCDIYVRRPMGHQSNMITAQGRENPIENTGISIHMSRVQPASDFRAVDGSFRSYLGRPWKKFSRTIIMKTNLDGLIDPKGWTEWSGNFGLATLYYGEYMNSGKGASTSNRVKWPGFHVLNNPRDAYPFTVRRFLQGDVWIPASGVPFLPGL